MSDYNSSLPVRTQNNGDVVIQLSDGTTPSQKAAVNSAGSQQVAGQGVAGTPAGGVVSVQGVSGGTAIPVSGTVTANNASVSTVGATPPTSATYIGALTSTSSPSLTTGELEPLSLTLAGALRVDGSAITQPVSGTVAVSSVSGTVAENLTQVGGSAIALGQAAMAASLPVVIASNQTAVPVSGTVAVSSIASALPAGSNTIGAVTQASGPWTQNLTQVLGAAPSATNALATQIATNGAYVSSTNPLPVILDPVGTGTPKLYYTDSSSIAVGSSATQSTTAAGTNGFYLQSIVLSGSGKFKATVAVGATTYFAAFNSTATPTVTIQVPNNFLVATGTAIVVTMTNNDLAAQDLYSTLIGYQI